MGRGQARNDSAFVLFAVDTLIIARNIGHAKTKGELPHNLHKCVS